VKTTGVQLCESKKEKIRQMAKRRQSPYGQWLEAKQKVKKFYGKLTERQFQDIYRESVQTSFKGGSVGSVTATDHFIGGLESRIDVLLYRSGFATSVAHANQWVNHGKVLLNEKRVYSSGLCLKAGDCLRLAPPFDSGIFGQKAFSAANAIGIDGAKGLLSVKSPVIKGVGKSSATKGTKGMKGAEVSKGGKASHVVDQSFGGHFVVSRKLASLVYLRKPKLLDIPKYPFVGKARRNRRSSFGAAARGSAVYIAPSNKEVYARVVAFCSR
jgi:ribosomal protein S4